MLVEHCNLKCRGCDKASPHLPASFSSIDQFASDIDALKNILRVEMFKLTGGEPLLHPKIAEFARIIKESGMAREVALWTNGLLLHRVKPDLFEYIDVIQVTRYPGVDMVMERAAMADIAKTYGIWFEVLYKPEFLEAFLDRPDHDAARNQKIFQSCKNAHDWSCHAVQAGHYFKCSRADILRRRTGQAQEVDGVPLHAPHLRRRLEAYLEEREPLASCAWCLGTSGSSFVHRQLGKAEKDMESQKWKSVVSRPSTTKYLDSLSRPQP